MNERFARTGIPTLAITLILLLIGFAVLGSPSFAEDKPAADPHATSDAVPSASAASDCRRCHTCDAPTTADPCLHPCSRTRTAEIVKRLEQADVPQGVILLDMLSSAGDIKDHFGPVPFDHTGHADWAEIAGGCTLCHHYTPEGSAHPTCRTCHEIAIKREDISKPGLKGAYHRLCLACHREWTHNTRCSACHLPRVGEGDARIEADAVTKDDLIGTMHPPIPEPEQETYLTKSKTGSQSRVLFRHKEHTTRFGIKCAECHRGDNCARCHEEGRKHEQHVRTLEEHHRPCSECHDVNTAEKCSRCHWKQGEPQPKPFDHASIGWPLSRYHKDNSCRACHKAARFVKLDRNCNACHSGWSPETFNHAVTGQVLNEDHAEIDCADCHGDRRFDRAPTCDECHDAEEISFPSKRPGPLPQKPASQ